MDEKKAEDGTVEAEDGTRGACADGIRMDPHAYQTACEACEEVDEQVACAAEYLFDEWADLVEHVHVQGDVDDAEVNEGGGEQTPPLVFSDGGGAEVAAPVEYFLGRGRGEGDAACHHGQKDQSVDGDQGDGDGVGAGGRLLAGLLGRGFGDDAVVHSSTVLALIWRSLRVRGLEFDGIGRADATYTWNRQLVELRVVGDEVIDFGCCSDGQMKSVEGFDAVDSPERGV
jgi:hypothetical protein